MSVPKWFAAVVLLLVSASSSCADDSRSATSNSTTTVTGSTTSGPTTTIVTKRTASSSSAGPRRAACTSEALLPLLKQKLDDPSTELIIERVDIRRCRNGYAHVFAVPRQNPPEDQHQYESEQLFLRDIGGSWQIVESGTGISCNDSDIRAPLLQACRALGYRP